MGYTSINRGYISTKGLYMDGDNLKLYPYEIEANGNIFKSTSAATVVDVTGLAASTWFAVGIKETDGTIDDIAFGGFDNWTISTNQLAAISIYDEENNYMRDSVSSVWYRIIGVFKVNAGQTACDYIENFENMPKSFVEVETNAQQTISSNTVTIVDFEDIKIDVNSNITVGGAWKYTALTTQVIMNTAYIQWITSDLWTQGEISYAVAYKNGAAAARLDWYEIPTTFNSHVVKITASVLMELRKDDYYDIRIQQNTGGDLDLNATATNVTAQFKEV